MRSVVAQPQQLLDALAAMYPESSRTTLRQMLQTGRVRVNGEIEQRHSRAAMQFRLIAEGQKDGRRFLVTSEVVADDEQEARELAIRFEPEDVRLSIVFEEVKKLHRASELPKGVYWRSDYVFEETRA